MTVFPENILSLQGSQEIRVLGALQSISLPKKSIKISRKKFKNP
jgi:hypothetical protein